MIMKIFAYYIRYYYQTRSKHGVLSKAYRWVTGREVFYIFADGWGEKGINYIPY